MSCKRYNCLGAGVALLHIGWLSYSINLYIFFTKTTGPW